MGLVTSGESTLGKLRLEAKVKVVDMARYRDRKDLLLSSATKIESERVRYDLHKDEDAEEVQSQFMGIARREKVDVRIRRLAKDNSLELVFQSEPVPEPKITRDQFRQLVTRALKNAGRAMKRKEILKATGLSTANWTKGIKGLISEGYIRQTGERNSATYSLA